VLPVLVNLIQIFCHFFLLKIDWLLGSHRLPFGGVGRSGMGNYHGHYSFECFTHFKSVLKRPFILDAPVRYPPYSPTQVKILHFLQAPRSKAFVRTMRLAAVVAALAVVVQSRHALAPVVGAAAVWLQKVADALTQN
jgi:hypothetical protein